MTKLQTTPDRKNAASSRSRSACETNATSRRMEHQSSFSVLLRPRTLERSSKSQRAAGAQEHGRDDRSGKCLRTPPSVGRRETSHFWTGTKRWRRDRASTSGSHPCRSEARRGVDAMGRARGAETHWVRGSSPWRRTRYAGQEPGPCGRALLLSTKPPTLIRRVRADGALQFSGGRPALGTWAHLDVYGQRRPGMAELVGDLAGPQTCLVEDRSVGLSEGLRRDPGQGVRVNPLGRLLSEQHDVVLGSLRYAAEVRHRRCVLRL